MTLDRTKAPEAKPVTHFKLKPAQNFMLDNGIPVCVVSGGSQPIANLQLVFNAGKWHESHEGQSYFTGKMLGEGTESFSNHEISQVFEQHGVFWAVSAHSDWLEMNFYSLNKQLKNVMPIIQEMLTKATFPKKELEQLKNTAIQDKKVDLEKSSYVASMKFKEMLFGKTHPYGYALTTESIKNTKVDALLEFYKNAIQRNGFQIFLAGEINDSHIQELNNSIGKIDFGGFKAESPQYDIPETKVGIHHINWDDALQSALRIGRTIFVKSHEEQVPFSVMNTILGGYFGSRLMQNIREEKGLTYGIYSSVAFMKNTGIWFVSADVIKDKKELALKEIYAEIGRMRTELVSEKELELVKNYLCGNFVKSINSPIPILNCHKTIIQHNLPADYYDNYIQNVRAVTAEQVQEMAKKYLAEGMLEVVVG